MAMAWLRAAVFFTLSVALALMAVFTALPPSHTAQPSKPTRHPLSLNASNALRGSGFNAIATLLHVSPEIFLSVPNSTIFAVKDSALFNTSIPPWLLKQLLQYHTLPLRLSMADLLHMSQGSCLPTLLHHKNVKLSKIDKAARIVEVNHVQISHPDIFLGEPLVVHGVLGPFFPLDVHQGPDYIKSPLCRKDNKRVEIEWSQIVQLLRSRGLKPFAIGLHSVLDWIRQDHKNLTAVTVLVPPNLPFSSSASPQLYNIIRRHIIGQRLMKKDLASMPDKASVKTLIPHQDLKITKRDVHASRVLMISGVKIVAPDMFSSKTFIIHGISRALWKPRHNASL